MSDFVTRDPRTGLRCTPTYWTQAGKTPPPDGCRWCGHDKLGHAQLWKPSIGWHKWAQPTSAQRLARMKARRAAQIDSREAEVFGNA